MKKIVFLALIVTLLFNIPVYAENSKISVALDGKTISFDTEPVIENGTTLVPLRAIFEALGATVEWNGDTQTVVSTLDDTTVSLTINAKTAYKNGNSFSLLAAPQIIDNRTLVPVRFIAESFGLDVSWEADTKTVLIESGKDWVTRKIDSLGYTSNTVITVAGGDLSGSRAANVKVDVGYGDREYWAFTNKYGQLVAVIAEKVTLQNENSESVTDDGRYYSDEAKVPGTEAVDLDEGHVIADSLGGVSNAYNITPQNSTLNRYGDQAYMEKVIRDAGGCTDFVAIITYPDTKTQIPSHYSYTYTLQGNVINDEFDNVDPDKVNASLDETSDNKSTVAETSGSDAVKIIELDKKAEYIVIKNVSSDTINITGWVIVSVKGNQRFTFPKCSLAPNATVKVGDSGKNSDVDFHWLDGRGTWNNSESDPAELYDSKGSLIDRYFD